MYSIYIIIYFILQSIDVYKIYSIQRYWNGCCIFKICNTVLMFMWCSSDIWFVNLLQEEFAEALAEPPDSLFVTQLFWFIDRDENGYITFKELISFIMLLTKGTHWDKKYAIYYIRKKY